MKMALVAAHDGEENAIDQATQATKATHQNPPQRYEKVVPESAAFATTS